MEKQQDPTENDKLATMKIVSLVVLNILLTVVSCTSGEKETPSKNQTEKGYQIEPVDIQQIQLTDSFWLPIIERVQEKTIAYALAKCEEEGRIENFLIAGGQMEGTVRGEMPFDDTDVIKL